MSRRIFRIVIVIAIAIGVLLFFMKGSLSNLTLIVISSLDFLVLSFGIHGLIAHSMIPRSKAALISFPIFMWALWAVLFLVFIFLVLPLYCPDFLSNL